MSSEDILAYIRKRRAQLKKALEELDAAERVIMTARGQQSQLALTEPAGWNYALQEQLAPEVAASAPRPKNIQAMIYEVLADSYPYGMTANDILHQIQQRWLPNLERTSLSPQLSRLKAKHVISNVRQRWNLEVKREQAPPPPTAPAAEGENDIGVKDSEPDNDET